MRISDAARAAGCSVRAVRHYHASGALAEPARLVNGYRDYTVPDLVALLRVRTLVTAGLTLSEISDDSSPLIDVAFTRLRNREAALAQQRLELERLRDGDLGVPDDLRSGIHTLLGDCPYSAMELASLDLMGFAGVATAATWEVIRRNLSTPDRRKEALTASRLWEELGRVSTHSAEADRAILELRHLVGGGLTADFYPTLNPGSLPLQPSDFIELVGAQERALLELTRE